MAAALDAEPEVAMRTFTCGILSLMLALAAVGAAGQGARNGGLAEHPGLAGTALEAPVREALRRAGNDPAALERALAPYCLIEVEINPESRVKAARGTAAPVLPVAGEGWTPFLVRVRNEAGVTAPLRVAVEGGWLEARLLPNPGGGAPLTGQAVEYRVLSLRAREAGMREARLRFDVGQGTQDLGFRSEVDVLFTLQGGTDAPAPPSAQALGAHAARIREAMEIAGEPLSADTVALLESAGRDPDPRRAAAVIDRALGRYCIATVDLHPFGGIAAAPAEARPLLVEQGWRAFLVRVRNHAGATSTLRLDSPNARDVPNAPPGEVDRRWLGVQAVEGRPLQAELSGLPLEFRVVQLYSRDAGKRNATLQFNLGQWKLPTGPDGKPVSPLVREWRFDRGTDGWSAQNQCSLEARGGVLRVTSTGNDPFMAAPVSAPGGRMLVRFRAKAEADSGGQVYWWTRDRPGADGRRMRGFRLERGDGGWREYALSIQVEGELAGLRLDPGSAPGVVEIESIRLAYQDEPGPATAEMPLAVWSEPSHPVTFRVRDERGKPAMASFQIRDARGRVYPAQAKRLAPDFFFHTQVYRGDGESVRLPRGIYTVRCSRGPESVPEMKTLVVGDAPGLLTYRVRRWVDPAARGWYSGDHHIHAAGCLHYTNPSEGVHPEDMARHIMGEDLKVGANLTWGPCFDYQKQFFTGGVDKTSRYPYLLRYDVEVSGFGSHQSGHLCLLRLKDQIYPGGDSKDHWPTLGLNTLRWAKRQGAVTGPAHSALGLTNSVGRLAAEDGPGGLPSYAIPAYDGIGANEFVVDITHEVPGPDGKPVPAVDFISTMNTDRRAEMNMWYHALNCGFRVRASGETDFPCITGERVGLGRVYVKQGGRLTYDDWCQGIQDGRSYVSDGFHHLMDFAAQAPSGEVRRVGERGSELRLSGPGELRLTARVAARREGGGEAPVEVVVNGYPAARKSVPADGRTRRVEFTVPVERSSWVALRTHPNAHTNPIFVLVDGQPVRASRRSAEWCLRGVDQCWSQKERFYAAGEKEEARRAYEHARQVYRRILAEATGE